MKLSQYIAKNIYTQEEIWRGAFNTSEDLIKKTEDLENRRKQFISLTLYERMNLINSIAEELKRQKKLYSKMICEEVGRCLRECEAEVEKTINLVDYYTNIAQQMLLPKDVDTQASLSQVCYEPLGLILAVMPWNYPIWQILRFAIPALCAGNACLIKPAPSVGRITEFFFTQILPELPIDYIFLKDDDIELAIERSQGLAFTGSVKTGRLLASIAGQHLKKTVLELGGSNAFIVFGDANLKQAAKDACYSRFRDAGQSCNATKRVIVEDSCVELFTGYLIEETKKIMLGNPMLESSHMGPLHLDHASYNMQIYVDDALKKGAHCFLGGYIPDNPIFYPPTILGNVAQNSLVVTDEVFGPVLPILTVGNKDEAIEVANNTRFGLGASIYSQDIPLAQYYAKFLEVGSVYINRHTSSDLRMPFGGIKDSGYGRELSEFGLIEFVNIKSYWQR
ncbi:MAG: aldehyde dehydrogenase family protein [Neisseriaceae bacterium]|nr:MAG: aldehyde dehydrogenase family protein [Neisseriaceae bacterium]